MGRVHVRQLAAHDFPHPADVDAFTIGIDALDFFAEEHIDARDPYRFAAKVADHPHESGVDFIRQHASDDVDGFVSGDAKAADKFCLQAGCLHGCGDRLATAMNDDGVDACDFEKNDVAHHLSHQLGVFHG